MSRQAPPQLSRKSILDAAIDLMDRQGYAAFSLPRLGDELGIRTPSLYHHFRDRAELLSEVARAVIRETTVPIVHTDTHWADYLVELGVNLRRAILRHPNTAPVLLQYLPRDVLTPLYEESALLLAGAPEIPLSAHALILDGLERLTIGNALIESTSPRGNRRDVFGDLDPAVEPRLAAVVDANDRDAEQLFVESLRAFLTGIPLSHTD